MFERVIIASGTSNRQTKALAASVRDSVRSRGMQVMSTEGEDNGEWIIVDCGAAVAHIMQPAIREYYHLEEIWGGKAVKMKMGEVNTKLVKASEPEPVARKRAKPAAADAAEAKAPGRPAGSRAAARAVKRTTEKEVAEKKATNRTAAFKRVAAKSPAKKARTQTIVVNPPVKKAAVKSAGGKPAAARKAPAKKAPAKKVARKS
jgi:ribosome-associated protein